MLKNLKINETVQLVSLILYLQGSEINENLFLPQAHLFPNKIPQNISTLI